MVDIYLESDELSVLGGPSSVTVEVDNGATGDRGSIVLYGYGNPNDQSSFTETPQIYDLYINLQNTGDSPGWLYQYVQGLSGNVWNPVVKLSPAIYNANRDVEFVSGEGTINIAVGAVVSGEIPASLTSANFNIQHEIVGVSSVVASTITDVGELVISSEDTDLVVLPITISAIEWAAESGDVGPDWDAIIDGTYTVHLSITVV